MKYFKRSFFWLTIALCLFAFGGQQPATAADKPIEWKMLSSWVAEHPVMRNLVVPWINTVNQGMEGKLRISWVGPEAVPPLEQLKPVREGVFDVLFTHPAYHAGDIAVGMGMDTIKVSSAERRKVGAFSILDEAYSKTQNCHFLSDLQDATGFHIILKKNCIQKADLKGYKIRSTPFYDPFIKALGGATVSTPTGEVYSALEKGVVDGAAHPAFGSITFKWYEVAKIQIRPMYGEACHALLVNLNSWNKLPADLQDRLTKITMEYEESSRIRLGEIWKKDEKEIERLGMQVCELPSGEAKKYLDTFYESTWTYVLKLAPDYGPRLKAALDKIQKGQ